MLSTTVAPAALLDSSDEVLRQHLRVTPDETEEDRLIDSLCLAAVAKVEAYTRRRLMSQTVRLTLDGFGCGAIPLKVAPVAAVAAVSYIDGAGDTQQVDAAGYRLIQSQQPNLLSPSFGFTWPVPRADRAVVFIDLTVGYASVAAVPADIVQAVRLLVAHWFALREATAEKAVGEMPFMVCDLLNPHRLWV
jgi:uncharacterized phiE125 gp8 family phage protein